MWKMQDPAFQAVRDFIMDGDPVQCPESRLECLANPHVGSRVRTCFCDIEATKEESFTDVRENKSLGLTSTISEIAAIDPLEEPHPLVAGRPKHTLLVFSRRKSWQEAPESLQCSRGYVECKSMEKLA
ncbi:hypothetical protein DUI87_24542 [Hirundo rustica rustica]|uniref:Uncharacterized protein n=1 Tax=Hirundo rustica rustica TaxID=333673 RepID=A0A3M0JCW1_HIRRU|nr:hypothetical protein DUI87_24542 [Hirundo rustica rustica]